MCIIGGYYRWRGRYQRTRYPSNAGGKLALVSGAHRRPLLVVAKPKKTDRGQNGGKWIVSNSEKWGQNGDTESVPDAYISN